MSVHCDAAAVAFAVAATDDDDNLDTRHIPSFRQFDPSVEPIRN